jgi:hypothetical protein
MSYVPTLSILAAVKAALEYIPHPTAAGEKLFERVEYHDNKRLREALTDLVIIKQRVALIVPGGDNYRTTQEGRTYRSVRTSTFDLLIADRSWTRGGHEASFGGPQNIGVLAMKELVVAHLVRHAQLGLPHVVLQPEEGAHIDIADDQVKDSPGRECFVISYSTPAGEEIINPTAPWPNAN